MILVKRPSFAEVREFLNGQQLLSLSYRAAGSTRDNSAPAGFNVDHNRIRLGAGAHAFEKAVEAVARWKMFDIGWVELLYPDSPIKAGVVVGVLVKVMGLWTLNACRVIYTIDEESPVRRFGFAYGTLPGHAESGEERFSVEWRDADDSVWYDLYAFSRPRHPLARLGYPVSRMFQKRFAADSKLAMVKAVNGDEESV